MKQIFSIKNQKVTNQSMTQELDLASEDPENFISDFVDEVSYKFQEFFGFKNRI